MDIKTARKIASKLNAARNMGGFLAFNADGSGGAWYADGSMVDAAYTISCRSGTITPARVIEIVGE